MFKKKLLIGTFILIGALAISAFSWTAINRFNEQQAVQPVDLTSLDAAEVSTYRWNAMAEFYATQNQQQAVQPINLTSLNAAEVSAYRWNAMAEFYAAQNDL